MSEPSIQYSVALAAEQSAEVVLVGIYTPHLALARPVPHYKVQGPLELRMGVSKSHETLDNNQYLVKLAVAAELVQESGELALRAEAHLEGIAVCVGLDEQALAFQLERALPARLFAHARVAIEGLTRDSGYRPVTLPPVPLDPADQPGASQ